MPKWYLIQQHREEKKSEPCCLLTGVKTIQKEGQKSKHDDGRSSSCLPDLWSGFVDPGLHRLCVIILVRFFALCLVFLPISRENKNNFKKKYINKLVFFTYVTFKNIPRHLMYFFSFPKLCRYLKNTYSVFNELNVPGPTPKWVFGNIGEFKDKVKKKFSNFSVLILFNAPTSISDLFKKHVELCI